MPGILRYCSACQAHRGAPPAGVLLCSSVCQAFDEPASLMFSCQCWLCGEREAMVMAPPPTRDSAVLPCSSFPLQASPTTIFPLTSPQSVSAQSTAALALGFLHNPYGSAPSHCAFQGTLVPVQDLYGCGKDYLILIPFRLSQIFCFTLNLKYFSSDPDNCPRVGIGPLPQFLHLLRAGPVLVTLLFPPTPPSSFILLSFVWFYICFFGWSGPPVRFQLVMHFCV